MNLVSAINNIKDNIDSGKELLVNGLKQIGADIENGVGFEEISEAVSSTTGCAGISVIGDKIRSSESHQRTPIPYTMRKGVALMLNGEIHILGSDNISSEYQKHYKYVNGEWVSDLDLPQNITSNSTSWGCVLDGEMYIAQDVTLYRYETDSWRYISTMPENIGSGSISVYKNEIHFLKGSKHYKFDGSSWIEVGSSPYTIHSVNPVVLNDEMHVMGNGNGTTNHFKFDGENWSKDRSVPYVFGAGITIVYNDEIHILGSYNSNYRQSHYVLRDGNWVKYNDLLNLPSGEGAWSASGIVYNNELWVIGGWSKGSNYAVNYNQKETHKFMLKKGCKLYCERYECGIDKPFEKNEDGSITILEDYTTICSELAVYKTVTLNEKPFLLIPDTTNASSPKIYLLKGMKFNGVEVEEDGLVEIPKTGYTVA